MGLGQYALLAQIHVMDVCQPAFGKFEQPFFRPVAQRCRAIRLLRSIVQPCNRRGALAARHRARRPSCTCGEPEIERKVFHVH